MSKLTIINKVKKTECCNTIAFSSKTPYIGNFEYEGCMDNIVTDNIDNYLVSEYDGVGQVGHEGEMDRYFYEVCGIRIIKMPKLSKLRFN